MPVYFWECRSKCKATKIPMLSSVEASTEAEAREAFEARYKNQRLTSIRRGQEKLLTYEQLVEWLRAEGITPEQARGAVQVMEINTRPENYRPFPCPECKEDIGRSGPDRVGTGYFCPHCHQLIQVG